MLRVRARTTSGFEGGRIPPRGVAGVLAALLLLLLPGAAGAEERAREADLRMGVRFLRSPELGGRRPGEQGLEVAARYLAAELRRLGLAGAGPGGSFFLPFQVAWGAPSASCLVSFRGAGRSRVLAPGRDFTPLSFSAEGEVEGPVLLAGYGVPETGAAGRVLLVVRRDRGAASLPDLASEAAGRGAAALLVVDDPRRYTRDLVTFADGRTEEGEVEDRGTEFGFLPAGSEKPRILPKEAVREIRFAVPPGPIAGRGPRVLPPKPGPIPAVSLGAPAADRLLGGSLAEALVALEAGGPRAIEGVTARVRVAFEREKRVFRTVAARRKGADEKRRSETVVVGARYDGGPEGDVGAAAVLGVAAALSERPPPPRPVLFLFWVGGGDGELGPARLAGRRELSAARTGMWLALAARGEAPAVHRRGGEGIPVLGKLLEEAARAARATVEAPGEATLEGLGPLASAGNACLALRSAGTEEAALRLARLAASLVRGLATVGGLRPARATPAPPSAEPPTPAPAPAAEKPPPAAEPTLAGARSARLAGRLKAAEAAVEAALSKEPGSAELYLERGRIRLAAKRPDEALADAENLEKLHPGGGRAELLRSEVHRRGGRPREADRALDRAAEAGLPEALLARSLRRVESLPDPPPRDALREALADLEEAGRRGGDTSVGHCARGILRWFSRDLGPALEELDRAIEKDSSNAAAYLYRAEVRTALQTDPAATVADCDRALELGRTDLPLWFDRGLAFLKLRMYTLSVRDFRTYLGKRPGSAPAIYNIACAHALMGNREDALDWLSRAMDAGFTPVDHARTDPDLASVRGDPRFERILRSAHSE